MPGGLLVLASLVLGACGTATWGPPPPPRASSERVVIPTGTPASFAAILRGAVVPDGAIAGVLDLPAGRTGPVPAVIIVDRLDPDRRQAAEEDPYAPSLTGAGMAVLRLDSLAGFGAGGPDRPGTPGSRNSPGPSPTPGRGLAGHDRSGDPPPLSPAAAVYDAFQALWWLAADPRIDRERIAILGVGEGGAVALLTAEEGLRRAAVGDDLRFSAHLAIYPECSLTWDEPRPATRPIFLMLGESDDVTPSEPCVAYAERLGAAGAGAFAVMYPGHGHGFDSLEPAAFVPDRLSRGRCDWGIAADGEIYDRASGARVGEDYAAFLARALPGCATRGGHAGATGDSRQRAIWEAYQFLTIHLRTRPGPGHPSADTAGAPPG